MIGYRNVLALIPARGGSKGIPRKNVRPLAGKPLIAWTINAARQSRYVDRIVVSTDDDEIALVSRQYGAEVPFRRPDQLATDSARGIDVVFHAIKTLPKSDVVVLLQPTSPFRAPEDIDGAIELWQQDDGPVVSVTESRKPPDWMYTLEERLRLAPVMARGAIGEDGRDTDAHPGREVRYVAFNRQELPSVYVLNGAVYVAAPDQIDRTHGFLTAKTRGFVMPAERSLDLDTELDWAYAEFLRSRE